MDAPKGEIAVSAQCTLNNGSLSIDDYGYCFILQTLPTN
jgi:hypothetical protein